LGAFTHKIAKFKQKAQSMKGRKPELKNVIPMRPDGDAEFRARQAAISRAVRKWLGLSPQDERNMLPGQGDLFDESDAYFR
jgi:hypothetical protein